MRKIKQAFTLAEVLITLSIIGIVSAIVVPVLMDNAKEAQYKVAYKKSYATLSQAWKMAQMETLFLGTGGWGSCASPWEGRWNALKKKFNIIKECNNEAGCWAADAEANGNYARYTNYGFVSNDGMYWISPWHGVDDTHISVDINGEKGPNKWGVDLYSFLLGKNAVHTAMGPHTTEYDGICQLSEPQSIGGRTVYFTKSLYD